jgi:hypothetical protein
MCAKNFPALLERVLDLACREQGCSTGICPIVLVVGMQEPELVVVHGGRVESADR